MLIPSLWSQVFIVHTHNFLVNASFSSTIVAMETQNSNAALERAIAKYPSLKAFADELGVPYQTVQQWQKNGVPAQYCPRIEEMTGGDSLCEDLNATVNWTYLRGTKPIDSLQDRRATDPESATSSAGRQLQSATKIMSADSGQAPVCRKSAV